MPVPCMPTDDQHPASTSNATQFGYGAALAAVRSTNRMRVFCSQCWMACRTTLRIAATTVKGTTPFGQRKRCPVIPTPNSLSPGRVAPLMESLSRIAGDSICARTASSCSAVPSAMSPSKIAIPSMTEYWTGLTVNASMPLR